MTDHIFISYSSHDKAYVLDLVKAMEEHGFSTWVDDRLRYGDDWPKILKERIEKCVCLVVVMSPHAEESRWVREELYHADALGKQVIPLLLTGSSPMFSLKTVHCLDVRGGALPPENFYDTLQEHVSARQNDNLKDEIDHEHRAASLSRLNEAGKVAYRCSGCRYPVPYDSLSGVAMVLLLGLPFIGSVVAFYLSDWLSTVIYLAVSLAGVVALISTNENLFKEPSVCANCGLRLSKPLPRYRS